MSQRLWKRAFAFSCCVLPFSAANGEVAEEGAADSSTTSTTSEASPPHGVQLAKADDEAKDAADHEALNYTSIHADAAYWDKLYALNAPAPGFNDSWQGIRYEQLQTAGALSAIQTGSKVLIIGCGDSPLPEELSDAGYADVTCVDFSQVLIDQLSLRNKDARPNLKYLADDATALATVSAQSFDAVIETGVLDSVVAGGGDASKMLNEMHRVVKSNGAFVSVSTEAPVFREELLRQNPAFAWKTDVARLPRPRSLDPRVAALDPDHKWGELSVYINKALDAAGTEAQRREDEEKKAEEQRKKDEVKAAKEAALSERRSEEVREIEARMKAMMDAKHAEIQRQEEANQAEAAKRVEEARKAVEAREQERLEEAKRAEIKRQRVAELGFEEAQKLERAEAAADTAASGEAADEKSVAEDAQTDLKETVATDVAAEVPKPEDSLAVRQSDEAPATERPTDDLPSEPESAAAASGVDATEAAASPEVTAVDDVKPAATVEATADASQAADEQAAQPPNDAAATAPSQPPAEPDLPQEM